MDIADMGLVRSGYDPFRDGVVAGDDQIICPEIQLLNGDGHQVKVVPKHPSREWQTLYKRSVDGLVAQKRSLLLWHEVCDSKQVRLRKSRQYLLQHALG